MNSDLLRLGDRFAILVIGLASCVVRAQGPAGYISGFEGLTAAPAGSQMWDPLQPAGTLGQDGFYWPVGTTSVPFQAYTYAGNVLGVPANPAGGGSIFIAGTGPASPTFARAQRALSFGSNSGPWTFATDVLVQFTGTLPATQNIGSFSVQPFPGSKSFVMLATWTDVTTAANWNADYIWFDSAGLQVQGSPGPTFQTLLVNHWYRWETDVNLSSNQILELRLTDLTTSVKVSINPVGWFMFGGLAGAPPPTDIRVFGGGGAIGNRTCWDNVSVFAGKVFKLPIGADCPYPPIACCGPCCVPGNSLRYSGPSQLGSVGNFLLEPPAGMVTPGFSISGVAIGLVAGGGPPCGVAIPGIVNNLLIGLPTNVSILSLTPWTVVGTPVAISFAMPPNLGVFYPYVGIPMFAQGLFLDQGTGQVILTSGLQMVLGG